MTEEERTVKVCAYCGEVVSDSTYDCGSGWDGLTTCQGCGAIEGDTIEVNEDDLD